MLRVNVAVKQRVVRNVYLFSLMGIVVGLLFSRFLISFSQVILLLNWIFEGDFKIKWEKLKSNGALIFCSIFLLTLLGVLYTDSENMSEAFGLLNRRIPLLLISMVIASTKKLTTKELTLMMKVSIAAVAVHLLGSYLVFFNVIPREITSFRSYSYKLNHVLFSMMIILSLYFMMELYRMHKHKTVIYRLSVLFLALAFLFMFIILKSVTVFLSLFFIGIFVLLGFAVSIKRIYRYLIAGVFILLISITTYRLVQDFTFPKMSIQELDMVTQSGNPYTHNLNSYAIENGTPTYIYVCEEELIEAWNNQMIRLGMEVHTDSIYCYRTLVRYLASKGLRKDREGVNSLSDRDLKAISEGKANCLYLSRVSVYAQIHVIAWGMYDYYYSGNPSGKTMAQRIEAIRVGLRIGMDHLLTGVGTGDLPSIFVEYYQKMGSKIENRHVMAHNSFVHAFIQFGIFGLAWFVFALFYPIYLNKGFRNRFFIIAFSTILANMISDNALWFQMPITYIAFFYSIFLFGVETDKSGYYKTDDQDISGQEGVR